MTRIRRVKPLAHLERDPIPSEPDRRPVNAPQTERADSAEERLSSWYLVALMIKVSPALVTALAALLAVVLRR
jgi:hypothetical protein